ncbi:MAG: TPM domain-containing protein [Spirosomataceae bacterium]
MFTRHFILLSTFLFLSFFGFGQTIPEKPNPPRLVNDFASAFSKEEVNQLEQKLRVYNDTTSTQLTVVIVPTIGDYDMNTFAVELGRAWGVGQKGKNNGLILLWSTGEKKVYIATGYGLEGALPDAYAKRIINNDIIPAFKEGRFYDGINKGVDSIISYLKGEYNAEESTEDDGSFWIPFLIILLIFIVISLLNKRSGGGGFSGGMPYTTYTNWGPSSGSWGGGSSSSGSDFGGFGGGDFGGGGAGGDY